MFTSFLASLGLLVDIEGIAVVEGRAGSELEIGSVGRRAGLEGAQTAEALRTASQARSFVEAGSDSFLAEGARKPARFAAPVLNSNVRNEIFQK